MSHSSNPLKKIMVVFGTRPEAIKLAPVIELIKNDSGLQLITCSTGQHGQMLQQVLDIFSIVPDVELKVMTPSQTLNSLSEKVLHQIDKTLDEVQPDLVIVQGDTTTAMATALAAFHRKIKVVHIEAGLRSHNNFSPYPEEVNRKIISQVADIHFAPTANAMENLKREQTKGELIMVGNTVVDALHLCLKKIKTTDDSRYKNQFSRLNDEKKLILVTGHRRENFGEGFENVCLAIKDSAIQHEDIEFLFVTHLNPKVKEPVEKALGNVKNVHLIEPVQYDELVYLMNRCFFILTDSGGIQEEAPSLGKPILVMRDVTERMEGVEAGTAKLVGTNQEKITKSIRQLLEDSSVYEKMSKTENPYGDGTSSQKIVEALKQL